MQNLQFDPMRDAPEGEPPPESVSRSRESVLWILGAGVLLIIAGVWFYSRQGRAVADPVVRRPAPAAVLAPPAETTPAPAAPAAAPLELPPLSASDSVVRSLLAGLSADSGFASLFASGDDLVRRGVRAVLAVAAQKNPRSHLDFLPFAGKFEVTRRGGRLYIAEATHRRYERLVDLFAGLDAARAASVVSQLSPLFAEATEEVAFPGTQFRDSLAEALAHLAATPQSPAEIEVVDDGSGVYRFAEPALEALSLPQKQLLRLGPRNGPLVRAKLGELSRALGTNRPPSEEDGG
jgi:hypothetical protein